MNSSFDHSKAAIDQSKISLDNSKLQQEFYGLDSAGRSGRAPNISAGKIPSQPQLSALVSDRKEKMEHSKNSRKESENINF
jgi:hypothetical protein